MESFLKSVGGRMTLEIDLGRSTGVDRVHIAAVALGLHHLRPGQADIIFLTPSTHEVN